jgi:alpha-mannosidase
MSEPADPTPPVTVHLVFNAHIDPVWLWPWQSGIDEALATCRSACDRLDRHPDLIFTRGEAWIYQVIERIDPPLFERIRRHIAARQWEIVGGWWIQPDCNFPSELGMRRQIELGRDYFLSRFGQFPRVAYNVDSFGHAAALPRLMRSYGQDRYVMMRPQEHEMALPARLFRWRGYEAEADVVAFRIAGNYEISEIDRGHVAASLESVPPDVRHTMCFVGVGDHGGGPTERQISWCRENQNSLPGCQLVFSSPSRFFDAVEGSTPSLAVVIGELQHHAIGCYSVTRSVKIGVRDAEHRLFQAELVAARDPTPEAGDQQRIGEAWRHVCFNQFHDTLGGTCIPSAYPQLEDQLGSAKAIADEIIQFGFRRRLTALGDDPLQRLALLNASDKPFSGCVTIAPWTEEKWRPNWRLLQADGEAVPCQIIEQEALASYLPQLVFHADLAAGEMRLFTLDRDNVSEPPAWSGQCWASSEQGRLASGPAAVEFAGAPTVRFGDFALTPALTLIEDLTGTWAHGLERYDGPVVAEAAWDAPQSVHFGPLMASSVQSGRLDGIDLQADWRTYATEPFVELIVRVNWCALHRVLKLVLPFDQPVIDRLDGVMGGTLERGAERRERPFRDFTLIRLESGLAFGVVCPDVFALDADERAVRLTLLRSPLMAHHHPSYPATPARGVPADQGLHFFRFQFFCGEHLRPEALDLAALALHRPPLCADITKGMPARSRF